MYDVIIIDRKRNNTIKYLADHFKFDGYSFTIYNDTIGNCKHFLNCDETFIIKPITLNVKLDNGKVC